MSTRRAHGSTLPKEQTNTIVTGTDQVENFAVPADQLKRDASDAVATAMHDLGDATTEVQHRLADITEEAKHQLGNAAEEAKGFANQQKDLLATQLDSVSGAINKVADQLSQSDATTAGYVRAVAEKAQALTSSVKDKNVDELLTMAQDFGRKQPVAFVGIAALLGFAASRFLMASARGTQSSAAGYTERARTYRSATPEIHEPLSPEGRSNGTRGVRS